MKDRNSYSYILIGIGLRLLRNLYPSDTKEFVEKELTKLKYCLEEVEFHISCSNLNSSFFKELEGNLSELEDEDLIGDKLCSLFANEMHILERHVYSESLTKKVHILSERRFNTEILLNQQENLFKKGAFEKLSELAQSDIRSACRCLLFGESTASAFHILRATEEVLKNYYFYHIRTKRLSKPMWGPMIKALESKTRNKPPKTLLSSLDLIRDAYRNPTQHPDAVYEIDSVQDLFGVCIDVIGKMATEL